MGDVSVHTSDIRMTYKLYTNDKSKNIKLHIGFKAFRPQFSVSFVARTLLFVAAKY